MALFTPHELQIPPSCLLVYRRVRYEEVGAEKSKFAEG